MGKEKKEMDGRDGRKTSPEINLCYVLTHSKQQHTWTAQVCCTHCEIAWGRLSETSTHCHWYQNRLQETWQQAPVSQMYYQLSRTNNRNKGNNNWDDIHLICRHHDWHVVRVHPVHLMNIEQQQATTNPQTNWNNCGHESSCRLLSSTHNFHSAVLNWKANTHFYCLMMGRRLSCSSHCSNWSLATYAQGCISQLFWRQTNSADNTYSGIKYEALMHHS